MVTEVKTTEAPITEASVLEKAKKGEELNDKEREVLKNAEQTDQPD